MSASLGIPGIMIAHDMRSETVKGFLATKININDNLNSVIDIILNQIANIKEKSIEITNHKKITKEKYLELFEHVDL